MRLPRLIQYDNPHVILIRDEANYDYPKTEINIGGKKIFKSVIHLHENDIFIAMSDGCPHAGIGDAYNFSWKREDIILISNNNVTFRMATSITKH